MPLLAALLALVVRVGTYPDSGFNGCTAEYRMPDGADTGVYTRWMKGFSAYGDWQVEWVHDESYADAVARLDRGEIDILPGVVIDDANSWKYLFPHDSSSCYDIFLMIPRGGEIAKAKDPLAALGGHKVGIIEGYDENHVLQKYLSLRRIEVEYVEYPDSYKINEAYAKGEVVAALLDTPDDFLDDVPLVQLPLQKTYFAINPRRPELLWYIESMHGVMVQREPDLLKPYGLSPHAKPLHDCTNDSELIRAVAEVSAEFGEYDFLQRFIRTVSRHWVVSSLLVVFILMSIALVVATLLALRRLGAARAGLKARTVFLSGVSHDIRTPLNVLIGNVEVLSAENIPEAERSAGLKDISRSAKALSEVVDDLLEFSKRESEAAKAGNSSHLDRFLQHMFENPVDRMEGAHRPAASATAAGRELSPSGLSVVCVDDIPMNLRVISLMLKGAGVGTVRSARSGEEAMKLIEESVPDILITDLWMPGMHGAELAAKVKKNPRFSNVRLVALTADADASSSFDLSIFEKVIEKPLSTKKLRSVISVWSSSPFIN